MPLSPFTPKDQLEIASLGTEFALLVIVGTAAGWWLDGKLGSLPWCLVGGAFGGFAIGLVRVIAAARNGQKQLGNRDKNGRS